MAAKLSVVLIGLVLALLMPVLGKAADAQMEHFRVKIRGATDYAVLLIVTDFWDKPLFWAVRPVQNGEAEYPAGSEQCKSICKAKAIDLTQEQYEAIRQELQLRRLENICRQLRSAC